MSVDVRTEIVIDAPRDEVAAYAADPSKAPSWYANIKSVEWETPPPLAVGSKIAFVAEFLGRRLAYTYEVTDFLAGERLTMRTAQGPFPMETTYTWTAEGAGTRMTLRNRGTPAGFTKLAAPLLTTKMRKANTTDLHTLKALLEQP
ncbi:SRPBCC family protein [Amycolatopsis japonica]|uniref:SRPBCC family protein n=1 Tax=Amycolatopsis japonica TaxID=208439 RepID=UPI0036718080